MTKMTQQEAADFLEYAATGHQSNAYVLHAASGAPEMSLAEVSTLVAEAERHAAKALADEAYRRGVEDAAAILDGEARDLDNGMLDFSGGVAREDLDIESARILREQATRIRALVAK